MQHTKFNNLLKLTHHFDDENMVESVTLILSPLKIQHKNYCILGTQCYPTIPMKIVLSQLMLRYLFLKLIFQSCHIVCF